MGILFGFDLGFLPSVYTSENCIEQTLSPLFFFFFVSKNDQTVCRMWRRSNVTIQLSPFNQKSCEVFTFVLEFGCVPSLSRYIVFTSLHGLMNQPLWGTLRFRILSSHLVNDNFCCPKLPGRVNVSLRNNQCNFPTNKIKPLIFYLISQEFIYIYTFNIHSPLHIYQHYIFFTTQGFLGLSNLKQQYFIILSTPTVESFSGLTASAIGTFVFYSEYFSTSIYLALYLVPQCQDGIYKDSIAIPI